MSLDDVRVEVEDVCAEAKARDIYASLYSSAEIEWPKPDDRKKEAR